MSMSRLIVTFPGDEDNVIELEKKGDVTIDDSLNAAAMIVSQGVAQSPEEYQKLVKVLFLAKLEACMREIEEISPDVLESEITNFLNSQEEK